MTFFGLLTVLSIFMAFSDAQIQPKLTPYPRQSKIQDIDHQIHIVKKMSFLNDIFTKKKYIKNGQNDSGQELFQKLKIRKLSSNKLDVTYELKNIQKMQIGFEGNQQNNYSQTRKCAKIALFNDLKVISTFGIPAKRFQGLNYYNYLIFSLSNNFYSLEGQNLLTIDKKFNIDTQMKEHTQKQSPKKLQTGCKKDKALLISSVRNQNFVIADFVHNQNSLDKKCMAIQISHIEMKNKQLAISGKHQLRNLIIEPRNCKNIDDSQNVNDLLNLAYTQFFTFYMFSNKRNYYIFSNEYEIHFYVYSEKAEKLVLDHNRTIVVQNLFNDAQQKTSIPQDKQKILKIVKLNTHSIVFTNRNNIFSINLFNILGNRKKQYLFFYETISPKIQQIQDIKFNDHDFKLFYVLTRNNIYQYQLSTTRINKKYILSQPICNLANEADKCSKSVHILESYILVQTINSEQQTDLNSFTLIQKQTNSLLKWQIPFSHERKCSKLKKIFVSKNKNSNYVLTLACFMRQSHKSLQTQKPQYLIFEHLTLQTSSDQLYTGSELNGIDFNKFRLPLIVFSIGLVFYITIKKSNKKTPEKIAQEQQMNKKFEMEIVQKIKRQRSIKESNSNPKKFM